MKKGHRNLLGRKNRSLFDTGVKMKDVADNGDLVLSSSAIPESGTASVRARPTVKHHISSDSFQGFAVPTPTVPVLPPPANGPKVNGSVGVHHNGLVPFARDLQEDDVFVPPPPSVAPPPPPGMSILPPPDFMGDLACPDLPSPRAPPFSAPKFPPPPPPSDDLASLRPPPMSPPKPPSTCSSGGESSLSVSPSSGVPEPPLFAPPEPPSSERQPRTPKVPPPKPVRLSSISTQDMPSWTPPPPPTSQTTTLSTFNPQNAAKVYSVPAASILSGYEEHDPRPKHLLLLEDSGPVVAHRSKPPPEDVPDLQENSKPPEPVQAPPPQPKGKVEPAQEVVEKPLVAPQEAPVPPQETPAPPRSVAGAQVGPNTSRPVEAGKFSPLLDRKLRSLKAVEAVGAREGPAASPLALLMAAKQRDKNKWRTSQEHGGGKEELPEATSGGGVPESSSETSEEEAPVAGKMAAAPVETPATESPPENAPPSPATESKEVIMPLLPPPPEFDDPDDVPEPPPAVLPPPPLPAPPPPPKPGPAVRAKPEAKPKPPPTRLSANQVTLLSILQKKMLEMDHKISPTKDGEPAAAAAAASDDWGAAPAEEDAKVPVVPRAAPQTRSPPIQPAAGLDLRELEDKVAQKHQEASKRRNSSTGVQSKHKYGMTFTIRPGTKQPITPYSREDSL